MATLKVTYTNSTYTVAGERPANHGVYAASFVKSTGKASLIGDMNLQLTALSPLAKAGAIGLNPTGTTVALANTNTKTVPLSTAAQPYTLYRTTSDGTIAGAVLNFPTSGLVDGSTVQFVVTGTVTTLTGTVSSAPLPTVATLTPGKRYTFVYNLAATQWFEI